MKPLPSIPVTSSYQKDKLRELQAELNDRRIEALRLYRPSPLQDRMHADTVSERLVIGGNRCLAPEQEIYDPVKKVSLPVSEIQGRFHVYSWKNGRRVVRRASRPFVKGYGELYAVTLSNGEEIRTTLEHRLLTPCGWKSVADVWQQGLPLVQPQSTSESCLPAYSEDGLRSKKTPEGCLASCSRGCRRGDEQPLRAAAFAQDLAPQPADARERSRYCSREGGSAATQVHSRTCRSFALHASLCGPGQTLAHASALPAPPGGMPCSRPSQTPQVGCRPAQPSAPESHTTLGGGLRPTATDCDFVPCGAPLGANVHAYITSVEFLRQDAIWDITVPGTHNYLAAGVYSHNSGKTMCTAIEVARAATGTDPYKKYPTSDAVIAVIGRSYSHLGMVCVPYLLRAGAFRIIRDMTTKQWRAFDPKTDADRKGESKPAPPLIPPRLIKSISWIQKSANYANCIELVNGTRIFFFSAESEPPQGFSADLVWVDEDIPQDNLIPELQARLADRKGRFLWSAMPHSRSESLLGLSERADRAAESDDPNPNIRKYVLRFLDNDHIEDGEKAKAIERWAAAGEDVLRMRSEGEFLTDSVLVYPRFHMSVHGMDRSQLPGGSIPQDWTRYLAVDPGHQVCAVLFLAVPPDGSCAVLYDELYIRQCNAVTFGEKLAEVVKGQSFYSFIIDMHGGRLRDIGSGRQVVVQYVEELRKRGVRSLSTGSAFMAGCDEVAARTSAVRSALHVRPDGKTKLRVLRDACPNLERELKRYRKKTVIVNGTPVVTDEPNTKGECHAVQCMEYLFAAEPKYVPQKKTDLEPEMPQWMIEFMERRRKRMGPAKFTYLGPQSDLSSQEMEDSAHDISEWV